MNRTICSEVQLLKLIASCVRRVHRLGERCDACLPLALERVDPPHQGCNWNGEASDCESDECQLEVFEAIEELRQSHNIRWPAARSASAVSAPSPAPAPRR